MIIKILGMLDLLAAAAILLMQHGITSVRLALFFGLFLVLKGYAFKGDIVSYIDLAAGVYVLLMLFGLSNIVLSYVAAIYLAQKAFFSLFT